jgi:hypothetical protein
LVEQYPLSVTYVATFAFLLPEQVMSGKESAKLISRLKPRHTSGKGMSRYSLETFAQPDQSIVESLVKGQGRKP